MGRFKKSLIIFTIIIAGSFVFNPVSAQFFDPFGNPCPPNTCGNDPLGNCIDCGLGTPLDSGTIIMIAGALAIGILKIRSNFKQATN
jgi:hypothetical protein